MAPWMGRPWQDSRQVLCDGVLPILGNIAAGVLSKPASSGSKAILLKFVKCKHTLISKGTVEAWPPDSGESGIFVLGSDVLSTAAPVGTANGHKREA